MQMCLEGQTVLMRYFCIMSFIKWLQLILIVNVCDLNLFNKLAPAGVGSCINLHAKLVCMNPNLSGSGS